MSLSIIKADRSAGVFQYGTEAVIDLRRCDAALIGDRNVIDRWVRGLVKEIGMVAYGDPVLAHFGHGDPITAGWTAVQLIETSSITAHFSPHLGTAYINVFSCRPFDAEHVVRFSGEAFGGSLGIYRVINR